jgi:glycosyltransferase involved in cell wall biosynthesis
MKFSICIPNFNYARYLGLTLESVLRQTGAEFEICVADNHSDDGSQGLVREFAERDARVRFKFNPTNVGFSDNLLAASQMAIGDWHILLSSDDIILDGALGVYQNFIAVVGDERRFAFGSACDKIDGEGAKIGYVGPRRKMWRKEDLDIPLSEKMGCEVYRVTSEEMMKRCFSTFYGFFNFASACYPAEAYAAVGGYIGGRMYGPDKWFHWRLLTTVDEVFFLNKPLFGYRWHTQNQAALQQQSRALKYLVDEYRNVCESTPEMFRLAGLKPEGLPHNFMHEVVDKQAFAALKSGQRGEARRVLDFGKAAYPMLFAKSKYTLLLRGLLFAGPIGTWAARALKPDF